MKFLIGCLFLAFSACFYGNLYAQAPTTAIKGKVLTENHSPATASTIILLKFKDSSIVSSAVIDKNGLFQFAEIEPGNYLLLVRAVGYNKSYAGPYNLLANQTFIAADIILKPSATQLKEVSVVSNKPDIEVKPGKIIINVQNSLLAAGNSAFDILRESPGVRVDNNNNISIVGPPERPDNH